MTSPRAMILAAGLGTRLRPLTEHIPKPLLPVLGRPILEHVLEALAAAGVREAAVNTHHLHERIEAFAAGRAGRAPRLQLYHEPVILGTGGALANARRFLAGAPFFLLHNGDVLSDLDLTLLAREHAASGALATLVLTEGPENRVLAAPDGGVLDILGLLGAPEGSGRLLTYTGIAALSPRLLDFLPPSGPSSLPTGLAAAMRAKPGCVRALVPARLHWNDVGTLQRYLDAHRAALVERSLRLPGVVPPADGVWRAAGASVASDAELSGFAALGRGSRVEEGARLTDCVLLDGAVARAGRSWRGAVIGPDFCLAQETVAAARCRLLAGRAVAGIEPLVEQGSDRQFFRVTVGGCSEVLMLSPPGDADFARYVEIGRFLRSLELGAPEILAADAEEGSALLEDLGDGTLYLLARYERDEGVMRQLYAMAVELLAALGARATGEIARCQAAAARALDLEQLRWETGYFRENFLERLLGMPPERTAVLEADFARLAQEAAAQPQVFIHRDYQSQNIIIRACRAHVVDFQGARLGPVGYDLASLLKDAYVELPAALRAGLAERYRLRLAALGGPRLSAAELQRHLVVAGLQRNMQALGAFCFLSLVKGKAGFRRFVRPGLARLEDGLQELAGIGGTDLRLPELSRVVGEARMKLETARL